MLFVLPVVLSALEYTETESLSFLRWCRTYNQIYVGLEYVLRFGLWLDSLRYITEYNKDPSHSCKLGLNQFSAMTKAEYSAFLMDKNRKHENVRNFFEEKSATNGNVPDAVDWRETGGVGPVKYQGQCGASWAFAATSAMEFAHFKASNTLIDLSEQNLIDCVFSCSGCNSGQADTAYLYVLFFQLGWFMSTSDYQYTEAVDKCKFDLSTAKKNGAKMQVMHYTKQDEADMKEHCATDGVLSAVVDASGKDFEFYQSGIYDNPDCDWMHPNLAVTIVGYGTTDGKDYWIVRNAWGAQWGENGYIRMSRNKEGQCGISVSVCWVVA